MKRALHIVLGLSFTAIMACGEEKTWPWQPFSPVVRPPVPVLAEKAEGNEIDAFLQAARQRKGTVAQSKAGKEQLLRRVSLDLIGLPPSEKERSDFLGDDSPEAYAKVVDRLLADHRHAERWARHWMDIWRYSDWAGWNDGKQIRDSQPHIWRWRDWIVDSLHQDMGYDQMVIDMLAGDERAPEDPKALAATGFLVRNYKMLSREQWLEDTVKHTFMAFCGVTIGCAKCHDHKADPIPQTDYYSLRAIFEPHQVRLDQVPGHLDTKVDGLARAYDGDVSVPTYFFVRGDERQPDKNRPMAPGVPKFLGGKLEIQPVVLPLAASAPHRREFVRRDLINSAKSRCEAGGVDFPQAQAAAKALAALIETERLEDAGKKDTPEWQEAAKRTVQAQREEALSVALASLVAATKSYAETALKEPAKGAESAKKHSEAVKALAAAQQALSQPVTTTYKPRSDATFPASSSGRRLAFAKWLTSSEHPLTARVAVNHVWTRHFGAGLVPTTSDFGKGARSPVAPELVDWMADDFIKHGWSLRHLHRLICLSATYQQASATGDKNAEAEKSRAVDPDNTTLWHFPIRRLEAEAVRDSLFFVTGGLDLKAGGPEIDQHSALTIPRRSLYFRCAAEKQPEFLQVFDGPSVVECYERKPSIMPQQALALLNSELALARAKVAAASVKDRPASENSSLIKEAFIAFLSREPSPSEMNICLGALSQGGERAREIFYLTLLNHHEFLTLR